MALRTITGNTLIKSSLRVLGVHDIHSTPTDDEMQNALESLIMMIEQFSGPPDKIDFGLKPWINEIGTLTLSSKASYDLAIGGDLAIEVPEEIITATRRDTDSNDNLLIPMVLEDYNAISNKGQTGTPGRYYYEREKDNGLFKLDYIPSDTTDTIILDYRRRVESPTLTGNIDMPEVSYRMLKYNLALDLAPEYGVTPDTLLMGLALQARKKLSRHYPEIPSTEMYFQPGRD